jgi:hypothetical protein
MEVTKINEIKLDDYLDCYVLVAEGTQIKSSIWTPLCPQEGGGASAE